MDCWPANCDIMASSAQLKLELGLSLAKFCVENFSLVRKITFCVDSVDISDKNGEKHKSPELLLSFFNKNHNSISGRGGQPG